MLYFGTVELRMTEEQFWNTTPRKFKALADAAIRIQAKAVWFQWKEGRT